MANSFLAHEYAIPERKRRSVALFWRQMPTGPLAVCWEWRGARTADGYGRFGARWRAHVVSWELNNARPVPPGMQVCHRCDNPSCVNPWHLFLGTHQDNIDDKMRKGRHGCGRGPRPSIRGENHYSAKRKAAHVRV